MLLPLLRLPSLAYIEVLKSMKLQELLVMSTVSKRLKKHVKNTLLTQKFDLRIVENQRLFLSKANVENDISIILKLEYIDEKFEAENWKFSRLEVPARISKDNWYTQIVVHLEEDQQILRPLLEHFIDVFNSPTIFLNVNSEDQFAECLHLVRRFPRIKKVSLTSDDPDNNLLRNGLDAFRAVPNVYVSCESTPEILDEFENCAPFQYNSVEIYMSKWVTANILMELFMDCKRVKLTNTKYSNQELLQIFKAWMAENSKMEYLQVKFVNAEFGGIFDNLDGVVPVRAARVNNRNLRFPDRRCYMLHQKNGNRAIVFIASEVILTTDFELL